MNSTASPTAEQITDGHWIVRFAGTKRPTGVIANRGIVATGEHFGDQPVYDAPIRISDVACGTTLASAARILNVSGYDNVVCFTAWRYDPTSGETTGERFDWF